MHVSTPPVPDCCGSAAVTSIPVWLLTHEYIACTKRHLLRTSSHSLTLVLRLSVSGLIGAVHAVQGIHTFVGSKRLLVLHRGLLVLHACLRVQLSSAQRRGNRVNQAIIRMVG